MRIENEPPFPTPGRILLGVLKHSGLWGFLPDNEKKSTQRELQRFAREESIPSWERVEELLRHAIREALGHEHLSRVVSRSVTLLLTHVQREVVSNATWLPRKETVRWLVRHSVLVPLTVAGHRAMLLYGLGDDEMDVLYFPEDRFWFLPDIEGGAVEKSPATKVFRWWLTMNCFDSPEAFAEKTEGRISVSTVRNWFSGRAVPDIGTLLDLNHCSLGLGEAEKNLKKSLVTCQMIARASQAVHSLLGELLGTTEADSLVAEYRRLYRALGDGEAAAISSLLAEQGIASLEEQEEFVHRALGSVLYGVVEDYMTLSSGEGLVRERRRGEFHTAALATVQAGAVCPPEDVKRAIGLALELQKNTLPGRMTDPNIVRRRLDELATMASDLGALEWYVALYEARLAVREGNFGAAFDLYVQAFHLARYRGGNCTDTIVREALSLGCHMHTKALDSKALRRKGLWRKVNYLRAWATLNEICPEIVAPDNREFIERARRSFEATFGAWLEPDERPRVTTHGENVGILSSPELGFAPGWEPDFRHPSRIVRSFHIRDISQLMLAILVEREDWALRLIELGADLSFSNTTGDNAFTYAMTRRGWPARYTIANALLDAAIPQAVLQKPTKRLGSAALMLVLAHRRPDLLQKLLADGCNPNTAVPFQRQEASPLCIAVCCLSPAWIWGPEGVSYAAQELGIDQYSGTAEDGLKTLKQLVAAGAEIDDPMCAGQTALSLAVELGLGNAVSVLLASGADPNTPGLGGFTPLCQAVADDAQEIAATLIAHGAWCDITVQGQLAIDHCTSGAMRRLLLDGMARGNCRSVIL